MFLALLAFDCAGFFHGDIPGDVAAIVALVLGVVALALDVRGRGLVP